MLVQFVMGSCEFVDRSPLVAAEAALCNLWMFVLLGSVGDEHHVAGDEAA